MSTLAAAWPALTGPRVEDFWVEVLDVVPGTVRGEVLHETTFESGGLDGWGSDWLGSPGATTIANTTARSSSGAHSLEVTYPTAAAGAGPWAYSDSYPVGEVRTAEIWVYIPTGSPDVWFGDPYGNAPNVRSSPVRDEWQRLELTWTSNGVVFLVFRSTDATTTSDKFWIDDFVVYEGTPAQAALESPGGALDGVTSCRVEHNVNAVIRGGCSLTLRDMGEGLDWATIRFRPWVRVNDMTWPLGVYLPASPRLIRDEHGLSWEVPCLDKMSILDQDVATATYTVAAGAVVTDEVAAIIASTGEASSVTPSDLTARSAMTWEPGTTKLRIVNDLLASINYFSIWCDRRGQFRAEPHRRPQDRALAATFAAGESSILSPSWSREQDIAGVPNRVVLIVEGDDTNPGMVATADNTDPASPYSTVSRGGRVVSRVYTDVEASSQTVLDSLAVRYLADASTPSATLDVAHATVPLDGNGVVRFADSGVDTLAVVEGWQVDLAPGALMSGAWREVLS